MQKDFITTTILSKSIELLQSNEEFKSLIYNNKISLLEDIFDCQADVIKVAMENQDDIKLLEFGTLKIKSGKSFVVEERNRICEELGLEAYATLKEEDKSRVKIILKDRIKDEFLKRKLQNKEDNPFNRATVVTSGFVVENLKKYLDKR